MSRRSAEMVSGICDNLFNALSIIIFFPIVVVCYAYRFFYLFFNWSFDFELGLEITYNISSLIYIIGIFFYIFGVLI